MGVDSAVVKDYTNTLKKGLNTNYLLRPVTQVSRRRASADLCHYRVGLGRIHVLVKRIVHVQHVSRAKLPARGDDAVGVNRFFIDISQVGTLQ